MSVRYRCARAGVALFIVVASLAAAGPRAAASGDPVNDPINEARKKLQDAQSAAQAAKGRLDNTTGERQKTEADIASLQQAIPALRLREVELRSQLADRAAALYRNNNAASAFETLGADDANRAARRSKLTEAAADYDEARAQELKKTADRLEQAKAELTKRKAQLDELVARLQQEQVEFEHKVAAANEALKRAEALGALIAAGVPITGPPVLSAEQLAAWFRSTGAQPHLRGITIDELATIFIEEGLAENVRGDLAFAQSIIETGSFESPGPNNFAGLGACDSCSSMTSFPTPRDGVRAQIQHLRNYADGNSRASDLHNPPSPYWYGGDPVQAAANFNSFFAKGWAPAWKMMGHGNWATDPGYADKVIGVFNRMVAFAQQSA
jgi:hypothetical protein